MKALINFFTGYFSLWRAAYKQFIWDEHPESLLAFVLIHCKVLFWLSFSSLFILIDIHILFHK